MIMQSDWLRDPCPEDVEIIGNNLREDDLIECLAAGHSGPQALQKGLETSDMVQTATYGGRPVGMLGVCPGGLIWLLGTHDMTTGPAAVRFIRECKRVLEPIQSRYGLLGNLSWIGNDVHHGWLEWLGFTVEYGMPITVGGVEHYYFWKATNV